ncbi:MAG: ribosome silencing factor [Actinobacteria bacterium]|nr:ribosome silencing factor [Actinomycetota bacterium]
MADAIDDDTLALARTACRAADEKQGVDIRIIDVSAVLPIVGLFVVTSAGNPRLVRTIAGEVEDRIRLEHRRSPVRTEGISESQWILLDYGDVVVHIFAEETRRFYEIERLYRDRPNHDWRS